MSKIDIIINEHKVKQTYLPIVDDVGVLEGGNNKKIGGSATTSVKKNVWRRMCALIKKLLSKFCVTIVGLSLMFNSYAATKTFEREYTYRASDVDSKVTSRDNAVNELRKILLREVGVYIRAERRSANGEYSEDMEGITAGIVDLKILHEEWDGKYYYVKARMKVDPNEVNRRITEIINAPPKITFENGNIAYVNVDDVLEISLSVSTRLQLKLVRFFLQEEDGDDTKLFGTPVVKFPVKHLYQAVVTLYLHNLNITANRSRRFVVEATDSKNQTTWAEYVIIPQ